MIVEKFYLKTRGVKFSVAEAEKNGIRRIYNRTYDMDHVDHDGKQAWAAGLFREDKGEAIIVESAVKFVQGSPLYIDTCIVFETLEMCNVFYCRHKDSYEQIKGFDHLRN